MIKLIKNFVLTTLVASVFNASATDVSVSQKIALLKQIESSSDPKVRARLLEIYEELSEADRPSASLLYCTVSRFEQNDALVIDYEERRSANNSRGQIVAKEKEKDSRSITFEVLPQADGYVRRLGGKKRMIYKYEATPSAYTFKTRTVIPGGNSWQINRLTGELTAYEGRGPCKKADAIKPKF